MHPNHFNLLSSGRRFRRRHRRPDGRTAEDQEREGRRGEREGGHQEAGGREDQVRIVINCF